MLTTHYALPDHLDDVLLLTNYKVSGYRHAPNGFGQRARWKSLKKTAPRGSQNPSSALLPAGAGPPLDLTKNIKPSGACHFDP